MDVSRKILLIGIIAILYGIFSSFLSLGAITSSQSIPAISKALENGTSPETIKLVMWGIFIGGIVYIVGGIAFIKKRPLGRKTLQTVSVINLINIPIGTVLGAGFIYFLSKDDIKNQFNVDACVNAPSPAP